MGSDDQSDYVILHFEVKESEPYKNEVTSIGVSKIWPFRQWGFSL